MAERAFSYFPGCSLATSAKENNATLMQTCRALNVRLVELEDWNCCGSSSAHSVDEDLADMLALRNLSLARSDRPLLVACPSCNLRLKQAKAKLFADKALAHRYREVFGRRPEDIPRILHFFELLDQIDWPEVVNGAGERLGGMVFAPYYGCMLSRPPVLQHEAGYNGIMERLLSSLGGRCTTWRSSARCCGTFLSVARPDVVSPMVDAIMADAVAVGAQCIVTACAMCHLNLEVRCNAATRLPVFHFSEILALALGQKVPANYFNRHLIDPKPLLRHHGLAA